MNNTESTEPTDPTGPTGVFDAKLLRMTSSPVRGLIMRMAAPTITIMLISAMYNTADTYFVGSLGTSATAAVGVSFSLMALIQATGFFFGHGGGNFIARRLGAGDYGTATEMASTAFVTSVLTGAVLGAVCLFFIDSLAVKLGSTPTILPHAREYLFYILMGAPWMAGSFTMNNLLRFQGSAFYGMLGITSGAVLNVMLDPLFIFVFEMGVSGASFATMVSQAVSFCILLTVSSRSGNIRPRLGSFRPRLWLYREIARGGLPSLCRQGLASIAVIFLNQRAGVFGDAAIAAMSITQKVSMIANSALTGWGQGFQPVCGFNYGAGQWGRVREAFGFCVKASTVVLLLFSAIGVTFAGEIVAIFRPDDADVIRMGETALRAQSLALPLMGWVTITNMMLQTIGRAGRASLLAVARQGMFLMPLLAILPPWLGLFGVQIAQPVADVLTLALSVPIGIGVLGDMRRRQEEQQALTPEPLEPPAPAHTPPAAESKSPPPPQVRR